MEKGFKNITNLTPKAQADRIREIEQKLQYITETKSAQQREQKANLCINRVSTIEKASSELFRRLEIQLREQRELVKEMMRQSEENRSEQDLLLKNRIAEINDIQIRFGNMWKLQMQRAKETERKVIIHFEERMESMRLTFQKQVEKRKQYFQSLDDKLTQKLPSLQAEIALKIQASAQSLTRIQNQIETETEQLCKDIKEAQQKQIASFQQLMRMMGSVIAEVKEEIALEKQSRQASKKKLVALFEGAYSRLSN